MLDVYQNIFQRLLKRIFLLYQCEFFCDFDLFECDMTYLTKILLNSYKYNYHFNAAHHNWSLPELLPVYQKLYRRVVVSDFVTNSESQFPKTFRIAINIICF